MTGQARTHNFTTLDAAAYWGSVPTTDLYGDPIAVNLSPACYLDDEDASEASFRVRSGCHHEI
jgi:hypothetical protein